MPKLAALNAYRAGGEINNGGQSRAELARELAEVREQTAEQINPATVKLSPTFSALWAIDADVLDAVARSMKVSGYDASQPLIVWRETMELLDGHTRRRAAITINLPTVPVVFKSFNSESAAFAYAASLQLNRRNITDADLFGFMLKVQGAELPGKGKRSERLALLLRVSTTKAKNAGTVLRRASEGQHRAIIEGRRTINQIYKSIKTAGPTPNNSNREGVNIDPLPTPNNPNREGVNVDPLPTGGKRSSASASPESLLPIDILLAEMANVKARERGPGLSYELQTIQDIAMALDKAGYELEECKETIRACICRMKRKTA